MNVFFPARDTAGTLTSNIIFMLARYPEVWAKLRKEVLDIGVQYSNRLNMCRLLSMKVRHSQELPNFIWFSPNITPPPITRWRELENLPSRLHPPLWRWPFR